MAKSRKKKILLTLAIVLVVAVIIGGGTFATFNASTTNASNSFAAGTVVLSDTVGATTCYSTGAGTNTDTNANSAGCAQVINVNTQKPGQGATTNVVLGNSGTLSGDLSFSVSACTAGDAAGETYHGTGDPCTILTISVDGTASSFSSGSTNGGMTSPGFGASLPASCSLRRATSRSTIAAVDG